jgi:hypothetical protein
MIATTIINSIKVKPAEIRWRNMVAPLVSASVQARFVPIDAQDRAA